MTNVHLPEVQKWDLQISSLSLIVFMLVKILVLFVMLIALCASRRALLMEALDLSVKRDDSKRLFSLFSYSSQFTLILYRKIFWNWRNLCLFVYTFITVDKCSISSVYPMSSEHWTRRICWKRLTAVVNSFAQFMSQWWDMRSIYRLAVPLTGYSCISLGSTV